MSRCGHGWGFARAASLALAAASLLSVGCSGGSERWVRITVDVDRTVATPLESGLDLDALVLVLEPDGCSAREELLPAGGGALPPLPQDVVVVLSDLCESSSLVATAVGLRGGVEVAKSVRSEVILSDEGAELGLVLARSCDDADGDAHGAGDGCRGPDCDDADPSVHPGAAERCNGADDDCDGQGDGADGDGDGLRACEGDCNDQRLDVFPGAEEICDDVDDDCDGSLTAGCTHAPNGGFEAGLSRWSWVQIDTEGALVDGLGVFDAPAIVEGVPGATGSRSLRVSTHAAGDWGGLLLCNEPTVLRRGTVYEASARVLPEFPGAPAVAAAVLRLHGRQYEPVDVGGRVDPPGGAWASLSLTFEPPADVEARLCLLFRTVMEAQGGPTVAGASFTWDDVRMAPASP